MTQEDKDLLFQDLCGRLPYGVKLKGVTYEEVLDDYYGEETGEFEEKEVTFSLYQLHMDSDVMCNGSWISIEDCKPYLFPMSGMTSEQLHEIQDILGNDCKIESDFIRIVNSERNTLSYQEIKAVFNYCYKNHLDINGLIPRGLGIDATGLGIY